MSLRWSTLLIVLSIFLVCWEPTEARMIGSWSKIQRSTSGRRALLQESENAETVPLNVEKGQVADAWVEVPFFRGVADHWVSTVEAVGEKANKHIAQPTKEWVASASDNLNKNLKPLVGEKAAPKVTTFICFILVIAPLAATAVLCSTFKHVLSLQRILMAIHLYLTTYFLIMAFAQLYFHGEPMKLLQQHSVDSYVLFQLLQSIGYLVFVCLQCLQTLVMVRSGIPLMQTLAWVELVASVGVGIHYYIMVWQPAMLDQPPNIDFVFYLFYSVIFGAMIAVSKYVNYTVTSTRDVEKLLQGQKIAPKVPSAFDGPEKRA